MSLGMNIPKCSGCGETFGIVVGIPACVSFDENGKATLEFDIAEIDDDLYDNLTCGCEYGTRPELPAGDFGDISDRLDEITEAWRNDKFSTQITYQITGYGTCGACGQQHADAPGVCDLDPLNEITEEVK